jgi:cytochrome c553
MLHKLTRVALTLVLALPVSLTAGEHVIPPAELHERAVAATATREANLAKAQKFFSSEPVRHALRAGRVDSGLVKQAAPLLSDDELARLAARVDKTQADFAAGSLTNEQLTYIVIALGTAVLILVIIEA